MVGTNVSFKLRGLLKDPMFHMGKAMLEDIKLKFGSERQIEIDVEEMLEFDWRMFLDKVILQNKGEMWIFRETTIFFSNDNLIGGIKEFEKFIANEFSYHNYRPLMLYEAFAEEAYQNFFKESKNDVVFFDIMIQDEPAGRLLIELFNEQCPKTCLNFKYLCTGEQGRAEDTGLKLHYQNSIFHRIVKNGWIQGGDIDLGKGNGGYSAFGPQFEDESFAVEHNSRGIVGMANHGRHTNRSQFYITLQSTPWMNQKYVAFGKIIEGYDVLKKLESLETFNERPKKDVLVQSVGVFHDTREKQQEAPVDAQGDVSAMEKDIDRIVADVTEGAGNMII